MMNEEIITIWNKLNKPLINFINQKVQDIDLSKDLSQEVFIKVYTKIDTLKRKDKVIPWIYQIARNEINDYFRKKQYGGEMPQIAPTTAGEEDLTAVLSACMLPMINALPEKYQDAVKLTEIDGLSQKDLAVRLNISYSGAKSRVQRGRDKLKELLLDCCTISADTYGNIHAFEKKSCSGNC